MDKNIVQMAGIVLVMVLLAAGGTKANVSEKYMGSLVQPPSELQNNSAKAEDDYQEGLSHFSYDTVSLILANKGSNGNYSPPSLYLAFAMLANGRKPEVKTLLLDVLGADILSDMALLRELQMSGEGGELDIGNSFWMQEGYGFNPSFTENIAQHYSA